MSLPPELTRANAAAAGDDARRSVWTSLTVDGDPFDIDRGLTRCRYSKADFAAAVRGDVVVVAPAAFRFASQMIAHAVLPADRDDVGGRVEIAVRRQSVRCARPYRFAYVGGRLCDVMAVSGTFAFVHRGDCDCDAVTAAAANGDDGGLATEPAVCCSVGDLVSSLMARRSSGPRCPVCAAPSDHQLVLAHLTDNIDRLSAVDANSRGLRKKYIECLNDCNSIAECQQLKTKMLNREMENSQRFVDGLVSSLLRDRRAVFRTGDDTITVKFDEQKWSASERFMNSIISSQNQKIANLTAKYEEILIMMNMMQLFSNVSS